MKLSCEKCFETSYYFVLCIETCLVCSHISFRKLIEDLFERGLFNLILRNKVSLLHLLEDDVHFTKTKPVSWKGKAHTGSVDR